MITLPMRYSWGSLKTGLQSPRLILHEVERLYYSATMDDRNGVNILSEDWDILAILDACRYDMFENLIDLPGDLKKVRSQAPETGQFLQKNFSGMDATDTVYVTGNPQFYRIQNGISDLDPIDCQLYKSINVWKDNWDEKYRTVQPEVITDAAIEAAQTYPNKRILIHYLQPHAPYIGPTGSKKLPTDVLDFWGNFRSGKIDVDLNVVHQAYQENLELVLNDVERLFNQLEGKIVLTADHGEMLGERSGPLPTKKYGHPLGLHTPELVEVPWFVYESGSRRDIVAEESAKPENMDIADEKVAQRLRDLGYLIN